MSDDPTHPSNPLEHTLVAAASEPSARPLFYRLLQESPLFILDASDGPAVVNEPTVLGEGSSVQAVCVEVDGIPHTAVFSSLAVLQGFVETEHKTLSMLGRDLLLLMRGSHLVLNPGAAFGKQITPDEIDAILSGAAARGYMTKTIERSTQVLLGQPARYPTHLTDALTPLLSGKKQVRAAYLGLCSWPETGEQHLVIGIDSSGDWEALMRDVASTLHESARPDEVIDLVKMSDSSLADYLGKTRPFYRKKIFGLF